ncbi:unnamed protein product [Spirodela intermedia]|uniref:RNA cytidine acetyltransferase n=1 Tax=Spirodela intermedia TaxID=51605 RepID=A0A7I8JSU8_SPIIN|nr:unnamed protein product [Spirodela intermedia]CAA6672821.1 unnamed protein product [Spirodela intermedia]
MRKKVDDRIRTLIENGVKLKHRSMFVIVGDKSRDQIVNLHYMLGKATVKSRPSVLCHKKKRAKQIKKLMQRGLLDPEKVDPFSLFLESGGVNFCLYRDSERILGNTFGMCILQDFEALTPNILARTIETVEGGGLVVLLLRSLPSLTSLFTMVMDVHERFRTESHTQATARFNERFLLSLATCKACVVMDDELNILPISSHMRSIKPITITEDSEGLSEAERDLKNLKEQLHDDFPVGPLVEKCCTMDQGKAVITFLDAVLDKTLRSTVALIASRGRGKSAALGLAIAGAIATGYSNIFVTAPSPENLKTLFDFVCKGLNSLQYKEHLHYDVVKSSDPELKKATIRINIYKQHRQTIQYIQPRDHGKLSQVELLVIDEAAAIPLPIVKSMLGPYLVFLSSTVNGYEGTGRSLSLKLLTQLEEQSVTVVKSIDSAHSGRLFKKVELNESIRYASGDPIESWLNDLLCLDVTKCVPAITRLPHPSECDLYYVNRDTLFSHHRDSEVFLQRMMALYVASHYKNSPNDLQLMSDAPAHHLFVLLGPVDESVNLLPDILCVIQVCLEGQISRNSVYKSRSDNMYPSGDQLVWTFEKQFQNDDFPTLSGARIVRIAVHPSAMKLGYGTTAVELLTRYYKGELTFSETDPEETKEMKEARVKVTEAAEKVSLLEETVKPREDLPPLLLHLHERRPERLHYLSVSFGLTWELFRFWRKHKFAPFYISQVPNAETGEHTCMIVKPLNNDDIDDGDNSEYGFMLPFYQDFKQRFTRLLRYSFRLMDYKLVMGVLAPKISFKEEEESVSSLSDVAMRSLRGLLSAQDMNGCKFTAPTTFQIIIWYDTLAILDLVPILTYEYFLEKLPVSLSAVQASILLCLGLQNQDINYVQREMKLEKSQIFHLFKKALKKFFKFLYEVASKDMDAKLPRPKEIVMTPHSTSVNEDLEEGAREAMKKLKAKDHRLGEEDDDGAGDGLESNSLHIGAAKIPPSGIISVRSTRPKAEKNGTTEEVNASRKKKGKGDSKHKGDKKRKRNP